MIYLEQQWQDYSQRQADSLETPWDIYCRDEEAKWWFRVEGTMEGYTREKVHAAWGGEPPVYDEYKDDQRHSKRHQLPQTFKDWKRENGGKY